MSDLVEVGKVIRRKFGSKFSGPRHVVSIVSGRNSNRVAVLAYWKNGVWRYEAEPIMVIAQMVLWGHWKVSAK